MVKLNAETIISRLKDVLEVKTDIQLGKMMNTNIANCRKRNSVPCEQIIKNSIGRYNINYIFFGIGEKKPISNLLNLKNDEKVKTPDILEDKELAELVSKLVKYGNKNLYDNLDKKLNELKDASEI
jgi:hypothetical protein